MLIIDFVKGILKCILIIPLYIIESIADLGAEEYSRGYDFVRNLRDW